MISFGAVRLRAAQVRSALHPEIPLGCEELAGSVLGPPLLRAFHACSPVDRAHQCRVALALRDGGTTDALLLAAALLHDVGKGSATHPPTILDRVALVVLGRISPRLQRRIAVAAAGGRFASLSVAARHAETGADQLRDLGAAPYLVWLVRHHHRTDITDDPSLLRLQAADRSVP